MKALNYKDELTHFGVPGMRWGKGRKGPTTVSARKQKRFDKKQGKEVKKLDKRIAKAEKKGKSFDVKALKLTKKRVQSFTSSNTKVRKIKSKAFEKELESYLDIKYPDMD